MEENTKIKIHHLNTSNQKQSIDKFENWSKTDSRNTMTQFIEF